MLRCTNTKFELYNSKADVNKTTHTLFTAMLITIVPIRRRRAGRWWGFMSEKSFPVPGDGRISTPSKNRWTLQLISFLLFSFVLNLNLCHVSCDENVAPFPECHPIHLFWDFFLVLRRNRCRDGFRSFRKLISFDLTCQITARITR